MGTQKRKLPSLLIEMGWFVLIGLLWFSLGGMIIEKGRKFYMDPRFWIMLAGAMALLLLYALPS